MTPRSILRRLAAPILIPQYAAVGVDDPQPCVDVTLRSATASLDVTRNNVVVALKPLTLGIAFRHGAVADFAGRAELVFHAKADRRLLGTITLAPEQDSILDGHVFRTYRPLAFRNACLSPSLEHAYYARQRWLAWRQRRRNPYNFEMAPRDLFALFVFYACPRPVTLVSVECEGAVNIFPMDLIGPTDSPVFSLALRLTSPAVELMKRSGRMAVSNIPLVYRDIAYDLGRHHKNSSVDIQALPFHTTRSNAFGLPAPDAALRVREVRVEDVKTVGSHCWFLTSIVTDTGVREHSPGQGAQLCHVHGACLPHLAALAGAVT